MRYRCGRCGKTRDQIPPEEMRTERGHLWHLPCAEQTGDGLIAFPCGAKLIPSTILESDEREGIQR